MSQKEQQVIKEKHKAGLDLPWQYKLPKFVMNGLGGTAALTSMGIVSEGIVEGNNLKIVSGVVMAGLSAFTGFILGKHKDDQARYDYARTEVGREILTNMVVQQYGDRIIQHNFETDRLEIITIEKYERMGIMMDNPRDN